MRKQSKSMLVFAFFMAFIAIELFFAGMTRTVHADPPTLCNPCNELSTINGKVDAIVTGLASAVEKLDKIPPTWSQILPASERFELVMSDEAVLDKETGLVWAQRPEWWKMTWYEACRECYRAVHCGRKGWRLPTVEELASLVDPTNSDPSLPEGHPFSDIEFFPDLWASTTFRDDPEHAWLVNFYNGVVDDSDKGMYHCVLCVRGGYGHDALWELE